MKQIEKDYIDERALFDIVLQTTALISLNQHGIQTDGRGIRGMKIFTKQTLAGISLEKILPKQNFLNNEKEDFWDTSSIASLSRNIEEGFLSLHFFGLEQVSEEEAELRFFLLQLHRNVEWYSLRISENPCDPELNQFKLGIAEQKHRIKNHPYLLKLTVEQRNKALRGHEIYKTKANFESELEVCQNLRNTYRLLSNLVHPLPLSIERIDNEKGRGIRNEMDMHYCMMSMMLARRYLAASTVGIVDHFPSLLEKQFEKEIDIIRPLQMKGFAK